MAIKYFIKKKKKKNKKLIILISPSYFQIGKGSVREKG